MKHGSLFSGIGGFDLAAEWMGWENVFHCEYNPFGQRVLKYYWPDSISYGDIKQTDFTIHRGQIDVLSGGFPCQPFSSAGKRKGTDDDRHLWPEMLRAIREISPRFVVGENVRGFTNWNGGMVFDQVQTDLEAEGYEVIPFLLPACAVNAPHRRDRIWIVAHAKKYGSGRKLNNDRSQWIQSDSERREGVGEQLRDDGRYGTAANAMHNGRSGEHEVIPNQRGFNALHDVSKNEGEGTTPDTGEVGFCGQEQVGELGRVRPGISGQRSVRNNWADFPTQPPVCQRNDGLSPELDGITVSRHRRESIMAYGNAIVPQVAYEIFKVIDTWKQ